jgi:hypothetical protein
MLVLGEVSVCSLAYPGLHPGASDVRCGGYLTAAVKRPISIGADAGRLHRFRAARSKPVPLLTADGPFAIDIDTRALLRRR